MLKFASVTADPIHWSSMKNTERTSDILQAQCRVCIKTLTDSGMFSIAKMDDQVFVVLPLKLDFGSCGAKSIGI